MKWIFAFTFLSFFFHEVSAQSVRIKRKHFKTYQGQIPAYSAMLGQDKIEFGPATIKITLHKDSLFLSIGSMNISGAYTTEASAQSKEIFLFMPRENSGIDERLVLNTSKRTLVRKGVFPQPDVILIRIKSPKR